MSVGPDLEVKKLEGVDIELGVMLAASLYGNRDPRSECFGLSADGAPVGGGTAWGVFLKGVLAGVLWLHAPVGGTPEITGLAIARGRWGMGLLIAMADAIRRDLPLSGGSGIVINVPDARPGLNEALSEAGFAAPDEQAGTCWRYTINN